MAPMPDKVVEYTISKYKPEFQMDPGRVVVLIGRSGSGKSIIARDLLYRLARRSHVGIIMSGTETVNGFYSKFVPSCLIFTEFRQDKIYQLLDVQAKKRKAREGLEADIATMTRLNRHADADRLKQQLKDRLEADRGFLVIDDLAMDSNAFKSDAMKTILFNSRHYNLTTIITTQYVMLLPASVRANAAVIFSARESIHMNRVRLFQHLYGVFLNFEIFERVFSECTTGYSFCVLDTTVRSMNPTDMVFWFQAELNTPPFKLCSTKWWNFNDLNFDPNFEDRLRRKKQLEMKGLAVKRKS